MFKEIAGNVPGNSLECNYKFWEMLLKTLESFPGDSRECLRRFREMFQKIPGKIAGRFEQITWNLKFDLFLEILLVVYQILLLNCCKTMQKTNY